MITGISGPDGTFGTPTTATIRIYNQDWPHGRLDYVVRLDTSSAGDLGKQEVKNKFRDEILELLSPSLMALAALTASQKELRSLASDECLRTILKA